MSKFVEGITWRIETVWIEEDRAITDKGIKTTIVRVRSLKDKGLIATSLFEEKKVRRRKHEQGDNIKVGSEKTGGPDGEG